jgi:hypothetical protein
MRDVFLSSVKSRIRSFGKSVFRYLTAMTTFIIGQYETKYLEQTAAFMQLHFIVDAVDIFLSSCDAITLLISPISDNLAFIGLVRILTF